jgi:TonB family protein
MLTYLFQVSLCWALFALLYSLLLRKETFFRANRFYLLGTLAAGLILPLANQFFSVLQSASSGIYVVLPTLQVSLQAAEQSAAQWAGIEYLWWLYVAGLGLAAFRLFWGLLKLGWLIYQSPGEKLPDGCLLVRTAKAELPFSFFHWIFVPTGFEARDAFQNMLAHERAHAHGRHSMDVLILELACIVFWFHPLAHWYRRSVRTVHEYLADADAVKETDRRQYGLLLLQQAQPALALPFANHFFQSPLKQRLLMLTKRHSASGHVWKYGLVLPITGLLWAFTPPDKVASPLVTEAVLQLHEVEKKPLYPGGMQALSKYLATHIRYPEAAKHAQVEGLAVLQITIDQNGRVSLVEPANPNKTENKLANQRPDMVAEAIRVVQEMPQWEPAYKNGDAVSCKLTLPIQFKLE